MPYLESNQTSFTMKYSNLDDIFINFPSSTGITINMDDILQLKSRHPRRRSTISFHYNGQLYCPIIMPGVEPDITLPIRHDTNEKQISIIFRFYECHCNRQQWQLFQQDSNLRSRDQNPLPYHLSMEQSLRGE